MEPSHEGVRSSGGRLRNDLAKGMNNVKGAPRPKSRI